MGKNLKESLKIIKARANLIRQRRESPVAGGELVEDLVDAGLVRRGAAEVPRKDPGASRVPESEAEVESMLDHFKEGEAGPIEEIEPGDVVTAGGETLYLIRREAEALDPAAVEEARVFGRLSEWPKHVSARSHGTQARGEKLEAPFDRESICFLDIETTGLSPTTYLFLIGLMYWEKGRFIADLVFARNYAEETAVLQYVRDTMSRFGSIVTYNGDRFDLPFIETRLAAARVSPLESFASVDLLYPARRVFRSVLPNCRLGTVERHIRGIDRTGDIPGRYIPAAYHDYVRTGDARAMKNVLYHNRMDLFTMAILINRLAAAS